MTSGSSNRGRFIPHAAWAAVAFIASLFLILTGSGGHPPAIIFLPVIVLIWVTGHAAIWGVTWLLARGRRLDQADGSQSRSMPLALRIAVFATGIIAAAGLVQLVVTIFLGKLYPYHYTGLWLTVFAIKAAHAACLAGLLMRKKWSRPLSAVLSAGWGVLLLSQIVEHLPPKSTSDIPGLAILSCCVVLLFAFSVYLAASGKVKSFLRG